MAGVRDNLAARPRIDWIRGGLVLTLLLAVALGWTLYGEWRHGHGGHLFFLAICAAALLPLLTVAWSIVLARALRATAEVRALDTACGAAEERFAALTRASRDAVVLVDPAGRVAHWSPAAEAMFGRPARETLGQPFADLLFPEAERAARAQLLLAIRRGDAGVVAEAATTLEVEARRQDGSPRPVEATIVRTDLLGSPQLVVTLRDLGEKRAVERAIGEQRNLLQTLLDTLPVPVAIRDPDGRVRACNTSYAALFGRSSEALLGRRLDDVAPPEVAAAFVVPDQRGDGRCRNAPLRDPTDPLYGAARSRRFAGRTGRRGRDAHGDPRDGHGRHRAEARAGGTARCERRAGPGARRAGPADERTGRRARPGRDGRAGQEPTC